MSSTPLHLLGAKLIRPCNANELPNETYIAFWRVIFAYLGVGVHENEYLIYSLRRYCKLFSKVCTPLKKGSYIFYPHPKYNSLRTLINRLNILSSIGKVIPIYLFIGKGTHDENGRSINIKISISIFGAGQNCCRIIGGMYMRGKTNNTVCVQDLMLTNSKGAGIYGDGASFHLTNVRIKNCESCGIRVNGTKRNKMTNCEISYSKRSGVWVFGGIVTISGGATRVHHNCRRGRCGDYGLETNMRSCIYLEAPLSKERISIQNWGRGNFGGKGVIKTIVGDK